jgi:cysteine desulfurase/selenocysteine lyase
MYKNDFKIFETYPELIYLDNAATTQKPDRVIKSITDFYAKSNANVHRGNYTLSEKATQMFEDARCTVAKFINAEVNEVIFTSGTTDSINKICQSLESITNGPILLTEVEHHSNIIPWQQMALKNKLQLEYAKLDSEYRLDLEDLYNKAERLQPSILAITHMSNVTGVINPIKEIISKIKSISPKTLVIVDAAQSAPHIKIDVKELNCDVLAFSGHKIFAPTGIGSLFIKSDLFDKLSPSTFGGGMIKKVDRLDSTWEDRPNNFEAGTPNIEGAIAMAEAIEYIYSIGFERVAEIEKVLTEYFLSKVDSLPQLKLFGPKNTSNRGPVFSFVLEGVHAHDLATVLNDYNIAVRAGHHCTQILHREIFKVPASSRASLTIYNTKEDIDKLFVALKEISVKFKR